MSPTRRRRASGPQLEPTPSAAEPARAATRRARTRVAAEQRLGLGGPLTLQLARAIAGLGEAGAVISVTETTFIDAVIAAGWASVYTGPVTPTPVPQLLTTGPQTLSITDRAQVAANLGTKRLPAYISTAYAGPYDADTGRYNCGAENNRVTAAALDKASDGSGVFHDVYIGASDMSMYDGTALRAPLAWPEQYRKMLATLGVSSGGTGLIPCMDPVNGGQNDSRLVYGSGWANFVGVFKYGINTAVLTFTPDVDGKLVLIYDQSTGKSGFTVKIGAGGAVAIPFATVGAIGDGSNQIGVYAPGTTVTAGTAVVVTCLGTSVPYLIGTIGTSGYVKHNLARSSMGVLRSADMTNFTSAVTDGAWDPTVNAAAAGYSVPARQAYTGLTLAGVTANRVTISLLANDLVGGKTPAQIVAGLPNIIAKFPGAQVRIVVPWQFGVITDANYEAAAAALWAFADANGYQLVDERAVYGNYVAMQAAGILGADGYHLKVGAAQRFGRKLALADLLAA